MNEQQLFERIPPHSEMAERSVLGAAMLDSEALMEVVKLVTEVDFYNKEHMEIFCAIAELNGKQKVVDLLTVAEELDTRGSLELIGGRSYLAMLTADVPSVSNAVE